MGIQHISNTGLNLIKSFEGCHLSAYKCPSGVWTIGYGHTSGVTEGMIISQQKADEFFRSDLEKYEKYVRNYGNKYSWNQNEFDALVSFTYNCGAGNLNKLLNNGNRAKSQIPDNILNFNKSKGTILAGLVRRRNAERDLFTKGSQSSGTASSVSSTSYIKQTVSGVQNWLNTVYKAGIVQDNESGSKTKSALIKVWQKEDGTLKVTGLFDNASQSKANSHQIKRGSKGIFVTIWQAYLVCAGYNTNGIDGDFGVGCQRATIEFQKKNELKDDGCVGRNTWSKAFS